MQKQNGTRLNKFISESGLCSRREADRYIEQGKVFINGDKAKIGDQVYARDRVMVNGHRLEPRQDDKLIFIALNKPVGVTSTTEAGVRDNIVSFVNHTERIFPIGRLDKDSQGLIFLTNDGDVVNKILRAGNSHEKEYVVTVNKPIADDVLEKMSNGVPMLGVVTKKCKIEREGASTFRITLIQGLNRQIRRMCEHFGYEVKKLERVRVMNIGLNKLPVGDWRDLTEKEVETIYKMVAGSSSTDKKKTTDPEKTAAKKAQGSAAKPTKQGFKPKAPKTDRPKKSSPKRPSAKSNHKRPSNTKPGRRKR